MSETEMGWTCGCGWNNGINLAVCATCGRTPSEGFGVGFDRRAELATETTERKGLTAKGLDAVWSMIVHSWSIETREFFEREGPIEFAGPRDATPLMKAIHHMWKRDPKVAPLVAELATLTAQVAEQAQEIAAKETMIAATDAEAAKALLLLTDAEAKLREQAQEIERLRREWEDAVERERRLAPSLADTQMMARDAQAKLSAVEALRDNLSITYQATLNIWPKEISERLTAILTPEAQ
jgi:hypothetical protein